jgi:putative hemolysin
MWFLLFTLMAIAVQGLFALFEMAALSVSRIRLQYYASIGDKRAEWLNALLTRPSRFFGTTLIGINAALQIGSECSRRFYESIQLDPDLAPITQVFLVVIFGELSPMFAARRHPSQIALALVPFMSIISRFFLPVIWVFDLLSRSLSKWLGKSKESSPFFSREEIALAFRERDEGEDELNGLTEQIFQFKNRVAGQLMTPLDKVMTVPTSATMSEVSHLLALQYEPIIPIYRHQKQQIVAVAHVRDLLRLHESQPIFEKSRSPWFVTKETSILQVLHQFRRNKQSVAIILDQSGLSCGILTLDKIVSQIFGSETEVQVELDEEPSLYIERTLPGEMRVDAFNREFQADIKHESGDTLSDVIIALLDHPPVSGETVRIESFVFTVIEPTIRGVGTVSVRSTND